MTFSRSRALKAAWLGSTAAVAVAMSGAVAVAQDADDTAVEEVVVTGSRIRQNPLNAKAPVQVLTAEDIDASGQVSIADFLQRLPIAGSAINRNNNSSGNLGFPPDGSGIGAGASEIDLRYLTSRRVLVLVDGKRWVRGSSASGVSGAVDLNTIPTGAIKSVEVLQDGASTVYGSDAIAGVVNVITSTNYDGFEASAYYGTYDEGDGDTYELDVNFGAQNDKGRIFIDVSYTEHGSVFARDRKISRSSLPGVEGSGLSSGTPDGRFVLNTPSGETISITRQAGAPLNPFFDPNNPTGGDFKPFTFDDRFNYQTFNLLSTPNERFNIFSKAEYDLTDKITFKMLAAYTNRQSTSQAAPEPLFLGPDGGGGFYLENIAIPADHPFNPFGFDLDSSNIQFFGRRPVENGPRIFDQNVDTFYISPTLEGSFNAGDREWFWDASFIYAQNQANQIKQGGFNARRIFEALGDPDRCAELLGCVPFNFFGGQGPDGNGSFTQEMLDYVTFTQKDESEQELKDFTANLSGSLFDLPAGPLGVALGFEYREEEGFFTPDSVVSSGETAGVPASPTAGSIEATEFYGEVNVPVVADASFAKLFEINGAFRYSDYEDIGSTEVFKLGALWQVTDSLTFRGNYSEGFRAPNIGELFNSGSRFDASITDPCSNVSPELAANCSALGVPADYQQLNPQLNVTTGGNPNLVPETSETWTVGLTWSDPEFASSIGLQDLTVEANYYDISIDDAIQAPNSGEVLEACVNTLEDVFCNAVTRSANGAVTRIDGILQNISSIETDGLDWSISATTNQESWGQLRFNWVNSHLFDYIETTPTVDGVSVVNRAGTELGSPERAFVEWKSSLFIDWTYDDFTVSTALRYIDSIREDCSGAVVDFGFENLCSDGLDGNTIDSTFYTDLQFTWAPEKWDRRVKFTVGAQNLFDESTPICFTCDGNGFDGTIHPTPGQFFYGRISFTLGRD